MVQWVYPIATYCFWYHGPARDLFVFSNFQRSIHWMSFRSAVINEGIEEVCGTADAGSELCFLAQQIPGSVPPPERVATMVVKFHNGINTKGPNRRWLIRCLMLDSVGFSCRHPYWKTSSLTSAFGILRPCEVQVSKPGRAQKHHGVLAFRLGTQDEGNMSTSF